MKNINRRRYPRFEIELEARIYSTDLNLSVTVVDISDEGIEIISEKSIGVENKIFIALFPIIKDPIVGIPVWSFRFKNGQRYFYRIGLKTEKLALDNIKAIGFPARSEHVSEILSQI